MTNTQVYAVIGGCDYEGEDFTSLQLFDCKSSADVYLKKLTEVDGFDYSVAKVMNVSMKSEFQ